MMTRARVCLLSALFLVVLAAGCTGTSEKQANFEVWAVFCDSYNTALIALAPLVADRTISDADVAVLEEARTAIGPSCREGSPVPTSPPTDELQSILLRLQGLG
jgi:hypothetical protein